MNVSIIIPVYNNEKTLKKVLSSLLNQKYDYNYEIIIIDDKSTDKSSDIIKNYNVRSYLNEENLGLAKTLNKGILLSKYEVVITLHGDTIPINDHWISDLVKPLLDSNVVASCSTQIPPSKFYKLSLCDYLLYARWDEHCALNNKADAYKKDVLKLIGLFDTRYRTAGEDEDLALRIRLNKFSIVCSDARVIHDHVYFEKSFHKCIKKILGKEYSFGMAGGTLRRKYPLYKPGNYIFPEIGYFDGIYKVMIFLLFFTPYTYLFALLVLFLFSLIGFKKTVFYIGILRTSIYYPLFNMTRFVIYSIGYIIGLIKGKQK